LEKSGVSPEKKMKNTKKSGGTITGDRSWLTGQLVVAQIQVLQRYTLGKIRNYT
jgi:hypothetical protein